MVFTKTIIHISVSESGGYLPPLWRKIVKYCKEDPSFLCWRRKGCGYNVQPFSCLIFVAAMKRLLPVLFSSSLFGRGKEAKGNSLHINTLFSPTKSRPGIQFHKWCLFCQVTPTDISSSFISKYLTLLRQSFVNPFTNFPFNFCFDFWP